MILDGRMVKFLKDWANYIQTEDCNTDPFLVEGMTFGECVNLMDHIAEAINLYLEVNKKEGESN